MLQPLVLICQLSPVSFSAVAEKKDDHNFMIVVKAIVPAGWHVYAENNAAEGLDAIHISWLNTNIEKQGEPVISPVPVAIKDPVFDNRQVKEFNRDFVLAQAIKINGQVPGIFKISIKGFASNNREFLPLDESVEIKPEGGSVPGANTIKLSTVDLHKPAADCGGGQTENKSVVALFLLGVAGGLIALLTPCVFPMIPVTVSFFTGRAKTKRAGIQNGILYGGFIFLIYALASVPFHLIGNINPQIFNTISTNAYVNLAFFAIFIFFALSFFGLFEITLPSSFANRTDAHSGMGSVTGFFFMALTLAIVSFSCTGPILGTLLVGSISGSSGAWQLTAGMAGFGCALALPFALFAIFPNWLQSLPRSGGWMLVVKKILAFVELALALKFLSNADLVAHWGVLKREIFIGIWMLIALGLSGYLFFSAKKRIAGSLALFFAVYLAPGLTNSSFANLKLLSGFTPPLRYSIYAKNEKKGTEPDVINDYDKALALSKATHKPLLIDFTGWACVNCRKMEEQVWTNPDVRALIKDHFILVSLYVDDRKKLAAPFTYNEKDILTIGDKWAAIESENFGQVSQPLYVIISPGERLMNNPVGYTPDSKQYGQWLQCGMEAMRGNE